MDVRQIDPQGNRWLHTFRVFALDRPIPAKPFSKARIFVDKGLVFAVLRSRRKLLDAFNEPALLAATKQMRFKRSGNELVVYDPKARK